MTKIRSKNSSIAKFSEISFGSPIEVEFRESLEQDFPKMWSGWVMRLKFRSDVGMWRMSELVAHNGFFHGTSLYIHFLLVSTQNVPKVVERKSQGKSITTLRKEVGFLLPREGSHTDF